MDQRISDVAVVHGSNHFKSIDDILEIMDRAVVNLLLGDYVDMDYDHIDRIALDDDPLKHWSELRGAFSTMDGELLRFILYMKIPLEKCIRHELASRVYDEDHQWVGFDKAKEIWKK